jgi:hypothetical protein
MPPVRKASRTAKAAKAAQYPQYPQTPAVGGGQQVEVRLHRRHPGQERVAQHPARFRVVMCGRRWGKSACGIREACDVALKGQPVGWFSPSYKLALEAWRD